MTGMELFLRYALYIVQAMACCLFWIVVPERRLWSDMRTYLCAVAIQLLALAARAPFSRQVSTLSNTLGTLAGLLSVAIGAGGTLVIALIVCADRPVRRRLRWGVLYVGLNYAAELPLTALLALLTGGASISQDSVLYNLARLVFPTVFIVFMTAAAVRVRHIGGGAGGQLLLLTVLISGTQTALVFGLWAANPSGVTERLRLLVLLCTAVAIATDYLLYHTLTAAMRAQRDRMELENLQRRRETERKQYDELQENAREMARYRQEIREQLQAVTTLVDDEQAAARILREIDARLGGVSLPETEGE